jgi:hypothetical protein
MAVAPEQRENLGADKIIMAFIVILWYFRVVQCDLS